MSSKEMSVKIKQQSDISEYQKASADCCEIAGIWSKSEIERLLLEEDFSYQNINLPYGLSTGGYDRSMTAIQIFPEDMTGKSVLDLGCSLGFFCFEAIKRGASRVLGVDMDPDNIRKARLLANCLGSTFIQFENVDIERNPIVEKFDYVLCLNLLHHLRNPLAVLDNLIFSTRERLILEVATLGKHDRRKVNISSVYQYFLKKFPIIFITRSGTRGKREIQKFYMTPKAIENLLIFQHAEFSHLETMPSQHKDRFISIAHRRQIQHLLVVSGPTSAGKKTLMNRLINNGLLDLANRLGTPDASVWGKPQNANRIWENREPKKERFILHHDFLRPYLRSTRTHERDEVLDILDTAEKLTFVTVWTPPERLVEQITAAEIKPRSKFIKKPHRRHLKIREEYRNPNRVIEHYREWFAYTKTKSDDHVVVSFNEGNENLKMRTVDQWEKEVAAKIVRLPDASLR